MTADNTKNGINPSKSINISTY